MGLPDPLCNSRLMSVKDGKFPLKREEDWMKEDRWLKWRRRGFLETRRLGSDSIYFGERRSLGPDVEISVQDSSSLTLGRKSDWTKSLSVLSLVTYRRKLLI